MTIECLDSGSTLLFYGLDDVEKLKSIAGITSVGGVRYNADMETSFKDFGDALKHTTENKKTVTHQKFSKVQMKM